MAERPTSPDLLEAMTRVRKLKVAGQTRTRIVEVRRTLGNRSGDTFAQRWSDAVAPALEATVTAARRALEGIDLTAVRAFIERASEALTRQLPTNLQELEPQL